MALDLKLATAAVGVTDFAKRCHEESKARGWWDKERPVPQDLMLVVTELAEAMECYRNGQMDRWYSEDGKPEGFWVEIGDAVIRLGDLMGKAIEDGVPIADILAEKIGYNRSRGYRHGGKRA